MGGVRREDGRQGGQRGQRRPAAAVGTLAADGACIRRRMTGGGGRALPPLLPLWTPLHARTGTLRIPLPSGRIRIGLGPRPYAAAVAAAAAGLVAARVPTTRGGGMIPVDRSLGMVH